TIDSNINVQTALYAGSGNDVYATGSGNTTFYGGTGNNTFTGGAGSNTFVLAARTVNTPTLDQIVGGSGANLLKFSSFSDDLNINLQTQNQSQLVDSSQQYSVNLSGLFSSLYLGSGTNTATGNATARTIFYGGSGNNTLIGGSGNDIFNSASDATHTTTM